ncbi:MAG: hypothetical protein BWK76_01845 [Desulfobulbaceae bacterium A2]|nr:MAG: hypothetical protein BWK76_01845 [Desulfobulbaceae bacterium A2]
MTGTHQYNPAIHHRRSIRLQGYDYSQAGAYFITICTHHRQSLFGEIAGGEMRMNDAGRMVQTIWDDTPSRFDGLELDASTVMPNHIHGIMILPARRGESCIRPSSCIRPGCDHNRDHSKGDHNRDHSKGDHKDRPYGTLPGTVGRIIQAFKSITTHEYTVGVKKTGWPPFPGKLWQCNYWEHLIRNEMEFNRICQYIHDNPAQWESDKLYGRPADRLNETREPASDYGSEAWMV